MSEQRSDGPCICRNCGVEVRWIAGKERSGLPAHWIEDDQGAVCLGCRRQLAADEAVCAAPSNLTAQQRARLRSAAIIEFEVRRDPSRSNSQIAHAVHSSVVAIQKVREQDP